MSGGHFDHVHSRISTFAEELKEEIDKNNLNLSEHTLYILQRHYKMLVYCAKVSKDIDYLFSGDYSEDTFMEIDRDRKIVLP